MEKLTICTPPEDQQCWKKPFLKRIKDEYNVIFDGVGCLAVRIHPNPPDSEYPPIISLMIEDDGALHETDCRFNMIFADELIENLEKAQEHWKKQQKKKKKSKKE